MRLAFFAVLLLACNFAHAAAHSFEAGGNVVGYTYRNDDALATKTYSGATLAYNYDDAGRLAGVASDLGDALFGYNPRGRMSSVTLPNNVSRAMTYDGAGRLKTLAQNLNGTLENFSSDYWEDGKLKALSGPGYALDYVYDDAGRLATETRTGNGAYQHT